MNNKLLKLYTEIHNCHICDNMDKVCRNIEKTNINSDVLIVLDIKNL